MNNFLLRMLFIGFMVLALQSCKTKSAVVNTPKIDTEVIGKNTIDNYYNNKLAFSTLYIKSDVHYDNGKQSHNVSAEIKLKKDEQILVSIRFLGITMAKALITPTSVRYYEKINSSYFEGDFSMLSQWLGTDLDFEKVQNMILGRAIDDLKKGKYKESSANQTIQLDEVSDSKLKKSFVFDAKTFLLQNQEIEQTSESRKIQIGYTNHSEYKEATIPLKLFIKALQPKGTTEINLEYNSLTFNEELTFPYSVPNDYKRIIIQ